MDKLVTGIHLPSELSSIIENAEEKIYIVCPFIELHHHFKRALNKHKDNENIRIIVLFGKFSNNSHYKLLDDDYTFLKTFPNIRIKYHPRLQAKFYANEKEALITSFSMNHSSHNNNLEYGITTSMQSGELSKNIIEFIREIYFESETVYEKTPKNPEGISAALNPNIDVIREAFPRAYEKWTPQNDAKLEELFREKKSLDEIAKIFQRQPSAIRARIIKLELHEKYAGSN
jgi:hypothetical protein